MGKVIILGAKGRFGRAASTAFQAEGWDVVDYARNWQDAGAGKAARITGDVMDSKALGAACRGCDVIVNAINAPYQDWKARLPGITASVIDAARTSGATVMIPGNVYNYGADMPAVLTEKTPWRATTRKGKLRIEMEQSCRDAGVPTIVIRGGDFIERKKSGNWFDSQIAKKAHEGKTIYPGPRDVLHAWAYLPDMARVTALVAGQRDSFDPFEEFGFSGFGITGDALVAAIGRAVGQKQKVSGLPWPIIWMMGLYSAPMREIHEMAYLWRAPHVIDDSKLMQLLPDFTPTSLEEAMATVLG
ncbi:MAG: NAD(P)H-binding protein [Sulfitobacter sp.]